VSRPAAAGGGAEALEIIGAVERARGSLARALVREGLRAPGDPLTSAFEVTPTQGSEVNIHPSTSWPEMRDRTATLFTAAGATLRAQRREFALGRTAHRHGGGNLIRGAAARRPTAHSARPDMRRSLVTFWPHHRRWPLFLGGA